MDIQKAIESNWPMIVKQMHPSNRPLFSNVKFKWDGEDLQLIFLNEMNYKMAAGNRVENGVLKIRELIKELTGSDVKVVAKKEDEKMTSVEKLMDSDKLSEILDNVGNEMCLAQVELTKAIYAKKSPEKIEAQLKDVMSKARDFGIAYQEYESFCEANGIKPKFEGGEDFGMDMAEKGERTLKDGTKITTYKTTITSANILEVEAGTTGYEGGDSGHGGRTYFRIENVGGTDFRPVVICNEFEEPEGIEVTLGGDTEMETIITALRFIAKTIEDNKGDPNVWSK